MNKPTTSDKYAAYSLLKVIVDTDEAINTIKTTSSAIKAFSKTMTEFGAPIQEFGESVFAPFKKGVTVFATFDDTMRRVGAVTGLLSGPLSELNDLARQLGAATAFTAVQVAGGMASLGMMGFSADEIKAATADIMNLSQATGTDLSVAAEIAANNLRVFGLNARDIGKVADYLAATANGSSQTLADLGEALKLAGPAAMSAGQTVRQTSAALGVLANMGIRGSVAGSALARSYRQIADLKVREYLAGLGVSVTDAGGNLRNMAVIFAEVGKAIAGLGTADQMTALEKIFGSRGILAGQTLSIDPAGLNEFLAKLDKSAGYCQKAATQMEDGLGGAFRNVESAIEAVQIALGEAFSADYFVALVNAFAAVTRGIATFVDALGPVVPVVTAVAGGFIVLGATMKTFGAVGGIYTLFLKDLPAALRAVTAATIPKTVATAADTVATTANAAATAATATATAGETVARGANATAAKAETAAVVANTAAKGANAVASTAAATAAGAVQTKIAGVFGFLKIALAAIAVKLKAFGLSFASSVFVIPAALLAVGYAIQRALRWGGERAAEESARHVEEMLTNSNQRIQEFEARHQDGKVSAGRLYGEYKRENAELAQELAKIADARASLGGEDGFSGWFKGGNGRAVEKYAEQEESLRQRIQANLAEMEKLRQNAANNWSRALSAMAEAEDAYFAKDKSSLQNELEENDRKIEQLNEMYEAQIRLARARRDWAAVEEMQGRQDRLFEESEKRRQAILESAAKSAGFLDVGRDLQERMRKRNEAAQESSRSRWWDSLKEGNPLAYLGALRSAMAELPRQIQMAAERLYQAQAFAFSPRSDGGVDITEAEKEQVEMLRQVYENLNRQQDEFSRRLSEFGDGAQRAVESVTLAPTFSSRSLLAALGRFDGNRYEKQTAESVKKLADDFSRYWQWQQRNSGFLTFA